MSSVRLILGVKQLGNIEGRCVRYGDIMMLHFVQHRRHAPPPAVFFMA